MCEGWELRVSLNDFTVITPGVLNPFFLSISITGLCILMQKLNKGALTENKIKAFSSQEADFKLIFYYHIFFICNSSFYSCFEQSHILSLMSYVTMLICSRTKYYMLNSPFMSFHKIKRCCLYDTRQAHPSIVLASSEKHN